jgi:hypothetical protein
MIKMQRQQLEDFQLMAIGMAQFQNIGSVDENK